MEKNKIEVDEFLKIDFRIGTIIEVKPFEKAIKSSYKIWVDFGPIGIKKTSAQITKNYSTFELVGKQIIGIVNFPKKQIGDLISEVLVLGFPDENNEPILISPDKKLVNGGQLY